MKLYRDFLRKLDRLTAAGSIKSYNIDKIGVQGSAVNIEITITPTPEAVEMIDFCLKLKRHVDGQDD